MRNMDVPPHVHAYGYALFAYLGVTAGCIPKSPFRPLGQTRAIRIKILVGVVVRNCGLRGHAIQDGSATNDVGVGFPPRRRR
jgi:hypothetical protein